MSVAETVTYVPVQFSELRTASGHRFGMATLNSPGTLNALSLSMVQALSTAMDMWARDAEVAGVVLRGAGTKAFCAGGDMRSLHPALGAAGGSAHELPRQFFESEYRLDYRLHCFPKPLMCWGHGIVMGGGVGLMVGASHRVVTPVSTVAMPEIGIGLYPDVGGSWFLRRAPGRAGLFLGLTGAALSAGDAVYANLADVVLPHACQGELLDRLASSSWSADAGVNHAQLSDLLSMFAVQAPVGPLQALHGEIDALVSGDSLTEISHRLNAVAVSRVSEGAYGWLQRAAQGFSKGSPTSASLIYKLWNLCEIMSLADVLRLEFDVSLACCDHPDLAEGIRAVLVDKDKRPRWSPAALDQVEASAIEELLRPRHDVEHPLEDLV